MNQQLKKELPYIALFTFYLVMVSGMFYNLKDHKYIEPGSWANKPLVEQVQAKEVTKDWHQEVAQWGDLADGWQEVVTEIVNTFDNPYLALRVAHCESRFGRDRLNVNSDGSVDTSVFQINNRWHSQRGNLLDWRENIKIAKEISDEQGWYPWVCYNNYSNGW